MSKESKKKNEEKVTALLKLPPIYLSREWLHHHPIHMDGRRRESRGNNVQWSC